MTSASDFPTRFSDALVTEIKAEMGRQDLSSRALARLIGANAQFVSSRLDGGNPRTGERVVLSVRDLSAIAEALHLPMVELIERAQAVADRPQTTLTAVPNDASELTGEDLIDHVETPDLDSLRLAAKRGTRKADQAPWAE